MEKFSLYFILFIIYSFIGWTIEVINSLVKSKKFVNRGFLLGPYCPIYGVSSIIMILYLNQYKNNILTVFILAVVVCSIIEYFISYIMEKLFNARWWDYTNKKFNINGRVCLENAVLFGILGILLVYIVNPFISGLLYKINPKVLNIIGLVLLIIFVVDFVLSITITFKLKNNMKKLKKDSTEEINKKVKEILEKNIFNRRVFKAFPKYRKDMIQKRSTKNLKTKIDDRIDEISDKIENRIDKIGDKIENTIDKIGNKIEKK